LKVAVNAYEVEAALGIQGHWAVNGDVASVDTDSQPEMLVPATLKSMTPGVPAVAVIVSSVPYVGVEAFNEIERLGTALVIVKFAVDVYVKE
jgi:hypothetical protein